MLDEFMTFIIDTTELLAPAFLIYSSKSLYTRAANMQTFYLPFRLFFTDRPVFAACEKTSS